LCAVAPRISSLPVGVRGSRGAAAQSGRGPQGWSMGSWRTSARSR